MHVSQRILAAELLLVSVGFALVGLQSSFAQNKPSSGNWQDIVASFRSYYDVRDLTVVVPTVVEVPLNRGMFDRVDVVVRDLATLSIEPSYVKLQTLANRPVFSVDTIPAMGGVRSMIDGDTHTYAQFEVPDSSVGRVQMLVTTSVPITTDSLTLLLDQYVALPTSIEIRAETPQGSVLVVAKRSMDQQTIRFLKTTASRWTITLTYGQPLRVSELRFAQDHVDGVDVSGVRFLAQPGHAYRVYVDPDRNPSVPNLRESANLTLDQDVVRIVQPALTRNFEYVVADTDKDGVPDMRDNCVTVSNVNQVDVNGNGRGDACDDFDRDGVINSLDNCVNDPNSSQVDMDADKIGDPCDREESRLTERHAWIPWAGIGFAAVVLVMLIALTMKRPLRGDHIQNPPEGHL